MKQNSDTRSLNQSPKFYLNTFAQYGAIHRIPTERQLYPYHSYHPYSNPRSRHFTPHHHEYAYQEQTQQYGYYPRSSCVAQGRPITSQNIVNWWDKSDKVATKVREKYTGFNIDDLL